MVKKQIWEKKNPKKKSTPLTPKQKAKAKRAAKKHGREHPSLVDNINAKKERAGQIARASGRPSFPSTSVTLRAHSSGACAV